SSGVYQSQFGSSGSGDGQMLNPRGVAVDSSDNIYVSDTNNNRIQKFRLDMHDGTFSADITGLTCGTNYHYQAYATNSDGSSQSVDPTSATKSCYPDPPTNIQASINSSSSINVSWDAPTHTGDSPILKYYIHYRKVGDVDWTIFNTDSDATSAALTGLRPSTQYEIKVLAENTSNNNGAGSEIITATTGTPGFYLISNCQQFQDINNDLVGNYELARNIDCSDTINWNSGAGFQPIGNFFSGAAFSGVLAGNNYTISDLYIKQDNQEFAFAAPFNATNGALIQDVRIVRPNFSVSNTQISVVAGLIGYDSNSTSISTSVNNVHIINASLQGGGVQYAYAAGLIGVSVSSGISTDSRNEFGGTISIDGSNAGAILAGGLYGVFEGGTRNVDNSYANANITIENTFPGESVFAIAGGLLGGNGLIESRPTQSNFNHSYAAGSVAHNSAQPTNSVALGGIVGAVTSGLSIENSFARNSLTSLQPGVIDGIGGIIAGVYGPDTRTYTNNHFDADQAGTTDCIDPFSGVISGCTLIQGNSTYFYNNSTNAPLNTWDFDNIWQTTNTLPVFGKKVLTSITAIPESRLNGSTTPPAGSTPSITELTQKLKASPVFTRFGDQKTTSAPQEEKGIIGAIKRFLKNLPEAVLVSFPYALFSLLLLAAGAMLIQVVISSRRLQATKLLIAKQKAVAEERDTFWHLAANYLRAPITLMVGGVELLSTDKDIRLPAVAQLEVFTKNLQKKVFAIMSRIEQSRTLQDIHWPELEAGSRVLTQLKFWLPISLVAFFAVLMNLVAKNYRNLSVSSTNLAVQLLIFILVSLLFYWVLSALGLVNRKRKQAEALLEQQSATLDAARTEFIEQSATTLDNDLSALERQLDSLPASVSSASIIREGTHRLRALIDSFELLVAAENNKLNTLSPNDSRSQLNVIFDGAITSLRPLMEQRQITLVKPDFGRIYLPGNGLLLNQVIGSVLSNAVAFSPPGSTIEVKLKSDKDDIQLSVTNQGKIIDEDQLSHIFSPFMKADGYNALQLDHGGLGVNLYIDSLIMRHLSGAIKVTSDPNKGTTMTMRWPIARTAMAG
ncbi:MAG TPA: fibronectin type III domain-containing protein, partial [Candidatus Saccharibacteria bacterium]|nr:fibronectin type III domain-containing protein [Candidatus Saccharibacteria bacterium]